VSKTTSRLGAPKHKGTEHRGPKHSGWKRFVAGECGDSLVELSIAMSVLMMLVFGVIDCSRALYTYHFVSCAAQQGARYAIVRGGDWPLSCATATSYSCQASAANIKTYVQSLASPGITAASITVTPTWPQLTVNGVATGCNTSATQASEGCLVKVQVSYNYHFFLPYLPTGGILMTATSDQAIAY
jgi:Flp pilus assembly protein TadG